MADLLERIHGEIRARLRASEAAVHEYERLEAALAALSGQPLPASSSGATATRARASRGRTAPQASTTRSKRAPRGANLRSLCSRCSLRRDRRGIRTLCVRMPDTPRTLRTTADSFQAFMPREFLVTHCNRFRGSRVYMDVPIDTFRTHDSRRQA